MKAFHPHLLDQRLRVVRVILWVSVGAVLVSFFRAQILGHNRYQLQSETNRLRPIPLPAPRGIITDRNGRVLAENVPGYTVSLLPAPEVAMRATLRRLAPIVKLDSAAVERVLQRHRRAPYHPALVLADAPFHVVSALEERRLAIPGLVIQAEPKRHYPDGALAAHLVGYVGEVTERERGQRRFAGVRLGGLVGKDGLERQYDDPLRGADGVRFVEVSALGYMVREADSASTLQPVAGAPLPTTVDLDLQRYIAEIFPTGQRGTIIAMNPNTGEILALYSAPGFDPNAFVGGVDPTYWRALNLSDAHPLINRAIAARYPPGSIWKLAMAAMALKRGIVTARTRMPIPCRGGLPYGNRFFRCWRAEGHGDLTLSEAIAQSCDVYFYQLGLKLTLNSLLEDANAWGFRQPTGIDLPGEIASEFPTGTEYYDRLYGPRRWTSAVTLNLAIGQGENAQTPLGMVRLFQMLAADGRARTPYVVRQMSTAGVSLDLTPDHLTILRQAMINVVERGTARASRLEAIRIAGKTATAQNPQGPDHGWFVGFGPADKPEIVVGAIIEFSRHGSQVGPLVARVIAKYLGLDTTMVRLVLPSDSAPDPLQLLPSFIPLDTAARTTTRDTFRVIPPRPDR
ncbi:MAG: penicillin-binding protein 2 [Gemmatimonadales bacterium]